MKRISLLFAVLAVFASATLASDIDNYTDNQAVQSASPGQPARPIKKKSKNTNGVHTPYVIATNADGSAIGAAATANTGAAHEANSQVTASTSAATLVIARPTRRSCLVVNTDAAITVYIGAATVTSANGMPLKAGAAVVVSAVTLYQVIAASGSPVVAVMDEYD